VCVCVCVCGGECIVVFVSASVHLICTSITRQVSAICRADKRETGRAVQDTISRLLVAPKPGQCQSASGAAANSWTHLVDLLGLAAAAAAAVRRGARVRACETRESGVSCECCEEWSTRGEMKSNRLVHVKLVQTTSLHAHVQRQRRCQLTRVTHRSFNRHQTDQGAKKRSTCVCVLWCSDFVWRSGCANEQWQVRSNSAGGAATNSGNYCTCCSSMRQTP
jgi:hypothetical protein